MRLWRWLWGDDRTDSSEAREILERLRQQDEEVAQLGRELHEVEVVNHFSEMVHVAIRRRRSA